MQHLSACEGIARRTRRFALPLPAIAGKRGGVIRIIGNNSMKIRINTTQPAINLDEIR
jgi:hypothetical protein